MNLHRDEPRRLQYSFPAIVVKNDSDPGGCHKMILVPPRFHFGRSSAVLVLAVGALWHITTPLQADDWPQWLGPNRDGVWRETGIVEKFPASGPKVVWKRKIGEGYAGPAVAGGRVFITDRILPKGVRNPKNAFSRDAVKGTERVLCLDQATGKILWTHAYDCPYAISYSAGPRTTPAVDGERVYTLGAMGDLLCLDVKSGKVLWSKNFPREYHVPVPLWGFASHPLVDGNRLICLVGGVGSVAVAFDKITGKEVWRALSASEPGYAPPMIFDVEGQRQLIIWHPESVNGLDPETGKVFWSVPFVGRNGKKLNAGLSIPTPRFSGNRLFLTAFYEGSLMLQLNGSKTPKILWKGKGRSEQPEDTQTLHSIISTPYFDGKYIYGVCSYGELRCLAAAMGERLWKTYRATSGESMRWGNAFLVAHRDYFVLFNEKGDLILARLTPRGYEEMDRAHILNPTNTMAPPPGRRVIWSHPAFAGRRCFARNDEEIVCVSMSATGEK
jgi:outer membrane protein assembly factor BamB